MPHALRDMRPLIALLCCPPRDYLSRLERLASWGDVVPMSLTQAVYLVNDPNLVKQICQHDGTDTAKTSQAYQLFKRCMGEGMLTTDGNAWSQSRGRCVHAFKPPALASAWDVVASHVHAWLDDWLLIARREAPVAVYPEVAWRTFALSVEVLLGVQLTREVACQGMQLMTAVGDDAVRSPWVMWRAFKPAFEVRVAQLDAWLLRWVLRPDLAARGVLTPIVAAWRSQQLGLEAVLGEIKNILFAGFDTTSLALSWGIVALARHQACQQELASALVAHARDADGLALYRGCDALRHVIQEVLRLYPSVPGLERVWHRVPPSCQHRFKPGSLLRFSPYLLHRHPRYWRHPLVFWPGRFRNTPMRHRYAYMPFLLGPRHCIGHHLANAIMAKVLATLLSRVVLLPTQRLVPKAHPGFTFRPDNQLSVRLMLP